jgi:hypothetical protein
LFKGTNQRRKAQEEERQKYSREEVFGVFIECQRTRFVLRRGRMIPGC